MVNPYVGEFIGTTLLLLLGNGVVANVVLNKSKGQNSGWIVITFGWAMAVFVGVYSVSSISGAHLNPAVSIGLALAGKFNWEQVPFYILAQLAGAFTGAVIMWFCYRKHFEVHEDLAAKLAVFSTSPAIRDTFSNLISEIIATAVLVLGILLMVSPENKLGTLEALPAGLLVLGIGICLGGPTGYAINPARDLGPRLAHAVLPLGKKGPSDWGYAWIPIAGPILGGILAALIYSGLIA